MREAKMRSSRWPSSVPPSRLLGLLVVVLGIATATAAWSAPASQPQASKVARAEALHVEGAAYFNQGRFREALKRFEAAFALIREPNLLFNIGRCLEALGRLEEARSFYKRCATDDGVTPQTANIARQRAQALDRVLEEARAAPADETIAAGQTRPSTSARASRRTGRGAAATTTSTAPQKSSGYATWTWVTLGLGAALMAGGGVLVGLGQADHDEVLNQDGYGNAEAVLDLTRAEATDLKDSGTSKKVAGFVLLGVGGAAMATAVTLLVLEAMDKTERRTASQRRSGNDRLRLALSPTTGGAAALLQGQF
jgi:tetratricopeptide (TPR) repeat protein